MLHLLAQLQVRAQCGVGALCSTQVGLRLVLSDRSSASSSVFLFTLSPVPVLPWASPFLHFHCCCSTEGLWHLSFLFL